MVSEIQRECVLQEVVPISFRDIDDFVSNPVKPKSVAEPVVQDHGRLGNLGDSKWGKATDNRVHREHNHDGAVFSSSDVDIRRKDRKRLEGDTVAKWEDSVHLLDKH